MKLQFENTFIIDIKNNMFLAFRIVSSVVLLDILGISCVITYFSLILNTHFARQLILLIVSLVLPLDSYLPLSF